MMNATASPEAMFALLDAERANLIAQFARVPAGRRAERPAEGAWSAVEIAEHVARVEAGVAKLLALRAGAPLTATPAELLEGTLTPEKIAIVRLRDVKVSAPERTHPTGSLTPEAVMDQLAESRAGLRAAFDAADPAVLDGALHPHPFIGQLSLRAWVELIAHHDARHAQQMAEAADHMQAAN
jgi:hypothetical protein